MASFPGLVLRLVLRLLRGLEGLECRLELLQLLEQLAPLLWAQHLSVEPKEPAGEPAVVLHDPEPVEHGRILSPEPCMLWHVELTGSSLQGSTHFEKWCYWAATEGIECALQKRILDRGPEATIALEAHLRARVDAGELLNERPESHDRLGDGRHSGGAPVLRLGPS